MLEYASPKGKRLAIFDAWDDTSIAFTVPDDDNAFVEALSAIYLPPRYAAIHHPDLKKLEVIWTAFKLDPPQEEIKGREFTFRLNRVTHRCSFARSSDRLLEIAKHHVPLRVSETNYRNLRSFRGYFEKDRENNPDAFAEPTSFWIDNVTWEDTEILKLVRHINFYLRYYDSESPIISINPAKSTETINPKARYVGDGFPKRIVSKELEASLLVFYSASFDSNSAANFLNLYRIIEFVSYGHMHDTLRKQIRTVLNRPSALDDIERSSTELLLMLREAKLEREQDALGRMLVEILPVERLWREVCENKAFFARALRFEGDLELTPLISEKDTLDTFIPHGVSNFAKLITSIRNGLAHGKDSKSAKSILPTSRNFELLTPWTHLIALAAGEVVLHDGAH